MSVKVNTGEYAFSRGDIISVDPRALVCNWKRNIARGGTEIPVDEKLIALAKDMMPRVGPGDTEGGTSGQINPITVRLLPDRRMEVVGGFRRYRAAIYLIESGLCPNFTIKCSVSKMSDAEAALTNFIENFNREDPTPIQTAHAIRSLIEDYSMTVAQVAGRLKRSITYVNQIMSLVTLPRGVQESVKAGEMPVSAALEIAKVNPDEQAEVIESAKANGGKITTAKVKEARQKVREKTGKGKAIPRSLKDLKSLLQSRSSKGNYGENLATALLEYLEGKVSEEGIRDFWDDAFTEVE